MEGVSLKLYIEGEMPGHLVYGVCCCTSRSSTPSSVGVGRAALRKAEWLAKAWLLWLCFLCTVTACPFSSPLCQSSCTSGLRVQTKEALPEVGKVVRWPEGQATEMRVGQNGVFLVCIYRRECSFSKRRKFCPGLQKHGPYLAS